MERQQIFLILGGLLIIVWIVSKLPWKTWFQRGISGVLTDLPEFKLRRSAESLDEDRHTVSVADSNRGLRSRIGGDRIEQLLDRVEELNSTKRWVKLSHEQLLQQLEALKVWIGRVESKLKSDAETPRDKLS